MLGLSVPIAMSILNGRSYVRRGVLPSLAISQSRANCRVPQTQPGHRAQALTIDAGPAISQLPPMLPGQGKVSLRW